MRLWAGSNPSRALPLISWQSPRLVRPSVFLARSARLARYAVAQRVQNSRVWPHNGLKTRPTYATQCSKYRDRVERRAGSPRHRQRRHEQHEFPALARGRSIRDGVEVPVVERVDAEGDETEIVNRERGKPGQRRRRIV